MKIKMKTVLYLVLLGSSALSMAASGDHAEERRAGRERRVADQESLEAERAKFMKIIDPKNEVRKGVNLTQSIDGAYAEWGLPGVAMVIDFTQRYQHKIESKTWAVGDFVFLLNRAERTAIGGNLDYLSRKLHKIPDKIPDLLRSPDEEKKLSS